SNNTATTHTSTLSLHDALPISCRLATGVCRCRDHTRPGRCHSDRSGKRSRVCPAPEVNRRLHGKCSLPGCPGEYRQTKWPCHLRSEEHTSELQSRGHLVCRLLL